MSVKFSIEKLTKASEGHSRSRGGLNIDEIKEYLLYHRFTEQQLSVVRSELQNMLKTTLNLPQMPQMPQMPQVPQMPHYQNFIPKPPKTLKEIERDDFVLPESRHIGYKFYFTHDNGGVEFLVYVNTDKKSIYVYKHPKINYRRNKDEDEDESSYESLRIHERKHYFNELINHYQYINIWIPTADETNEWNKNNVDDDFMYDDFADGNSILVQIDKSKYIHIGCQMYEFNLNENVLKYHSYIGPNDVPYPVIIGQNNIYFVLDYKYVDKKHFKKVPESQLINAYYYYYGHMKSFKSLYHVSMSYPVKMISS